MIETFEFVSPKHPDKQCDIIADTILDAYLAQDPDSRVAVEVMGGHGKLVVMGEITSKGKVNIKELVQPLVPELKIETNIVKQSPEIKRGVDNGGAGDQGIMIGYACNETPNFMPYGYEKARMLCRYLYDRFKSDGKVQITLEDKHIISVVASFCGAKTNTLEKLTRKCITADEYFINPAGEWNIGGFDSDTGLSGRKIAVDNYGSRVAVGGGSFSGKDPTKVDRSGAYIVRKIAVDKLRELGAKEVIVRLAYVIGVAEPVMAVATIDGHEFSASDLRDLTPKEIIGRLDLRRPIYAKTAMWGHFGRRFEWDNLRYES